MHYKDEKGNDIYIEEGKKGSLLGQGRGQKSMGIFAYKHGYSVQNSILETKGNNPDDYEWKLYRKMN